MILFFGCGNKKGCFCFRAGGGGGVEVRQMRTVLSFLWAEKQHILNDKVFFCNVDNAYSFSCIFLSVRVRLCSFSHMFAHMDACATVYACMCNGYRTSIC